MDPRQEIRTVEYTADKEGFHATLNIPAAEDTPAVAAAKSRHLKLFNKVSRQILWKNEMSFTRKDGRSLFVACNLGVP